MMMILMMIMTIINLTIVIVTLIDIIMGNISKLYNKVNVKTNHVFVFFFFNCRQQTNKYAETGRMRYENEGQNNEDHCSQSFMSRGHKMMIKREGKKRRGEGQNNDEIQSTHTAVSQLES